MVHDYLLYVTFIASKIVLQHPKRDASKNVPTPTISEYYEILRANWIFRDDSNSEIRFVIRDLENKLRIFLTKITIFFNEIMILPFFHKLEFLESYILPSLKGISSRNSKRSLSNTCICNMHSTMHVNSHLNLKRLNHVPSSLNKKG